MPYPPSYGGVIDVFYKIKALHALGLEIHLHCFEYGRGESAELNKYCASVNYYPRTKSPLHLFGPLPFVVATRNSPELAANLLRDDAPVLFEGLHCCAPVNDPRFEKRMKLIRSHNIEHDYYMALARVEARPFRRMYFRREAKKLERFESVMQRAAHILAISPADARALSARYKNVEHVMAFHPYENVAIKPGSGDFALYHGNLEVGENNQAALFLVNEVFSQLEQPLIIAGNKPSPALVAAAAKHKNVTIKANISTAEIDTLIADAQINVLPTFQATGIKLKLLAALFRGRHCLVNPPMVADTGVENLCTIANDATAMREAVKKLFAQPFDAAITQEREQQLLRDFSNRANAEKIIRLLGLS